MKPFRFNLIVAICLIPGSILFAQATQPNRIVSAAPTIVKAPNGITSIYIVGDASAAVWAGNLATYFDPGKAVVANNASQNSNPSITLNESEAEKLVSNLRIGDIVLLQFNRAYATFFEGNPAHQVVHPFDYFVRDAIARFRAAGALPIIITADGDLFRNDSLKIAKELYAPLFELPGTGNTELVLGCLKTLSGPSFDTMLGEKGKAIHPADAKYVAPNILPGTEPNPTSKLDLQPFEYRGNQDLEQDSPKTPRTGKVVLALAGDSTVTYDQGYAAGFRSHLDRQLQVIDLSRGGRTTVSFRSDGRWDQIIALKPDYVMIQFGHNDGARNLPLYTTDLIRFVDEARAAGIKPILVTPISRRYWQDDGKIHSDLLPNVEAMKKVAADKNVLLMDLHQRSIDFYEKVDRPVTETWGLKKANPDLRTAPNPDAIPQTVLDKTHFNPAGSQAIGKIVSDELKRAVPELAAYIE